VELVKAKDAELKLRQEFEQWLVEGKEELSVKYDTEVEELHMSQDAANKKHDGKVQKLIDLHESDHKKHEAEFGVWRG
jgi:hypothetical protein